MDARAIATPVAAAKMPSMRWWREKESWLLLAFVVAVYFSRPTALSLRGEESRWANVAREMIQTGDYIVPRQQGEVFANRPPLNNWFLALSMMLTGRHDEWAVRLPIMLATLVTTLLVYAAARTILSPTAALVAGLAYASMGQVLQLGRHAESEAVLTMFVAASLLGWLACYVRGCSPTLTWCVGYGFAALAGLAKGPQGPAYFAGTTWAFCLLFDRAMLVRRANLHGIGMFVAITAVWQIPLILKVGVADALGIWLSETAYRIAVVIPAKDRLVHLAKFPWIALGCMLPWSGLLLGYGERALRRQLGELRRPAQFLGLAMVVGIIPLLISVYARGRYYMPLFPCAAVLAAIVVEVSLAPAAGLRSSRAWRWFLLVGAACAPAGAIFIAAASFVPHWSHGPYAQTTTTVCTFALCAAVTCWLCREALARYNTRTSYRAACALAVFCGMTYTVVVINAYQRRSTDPHGDVAQVMRHVPTDAKFVSFTTIHHLFAYYTAETTGLRIDRADPNAPPSSPGADWEYFCFNSWDTSPQSLPFRWEQLGTVSIERNKQLQAINYVVVGRRLPEVEPAPTSPSVVRPTVETAVRPAGTNR